ncbi:hypothetical protein LBMAG53_08730 [Planctomycetota bacterium]|nr:hypothetical protein LBMAG53_08730 [Planctomycetota bacterium]
MPAHLLLFAVVLAAEPVSAGTGSGPAVLSEIGLPPGTELAAIAWAGSATSAGLWLAANLDSPVSGVAVVGMAEQSPRCRIGAAVRLGWSGSGGSATAPTLETVTGETIQFAPGLFEATTVAVGDGCLYLAGYGSPALEPLVASCGGVLARHPHAALPATTGDGAVARTDDRDSRADGLHLRRIGAPVVLRFDLGGPGPRLVAATFLEGWQQVWEHRRPEPQPTESAWQPTQVVVLPDGDLAVGHDGGYSLADDLRTALTEVPEAQRGRVNEYHVCDHISRISSDLRQRRWRHDLYAPRVDQAVAAQIKDGWPFDHFGNPRLLGLTGTADGGLLASGWAASATSQEPMWVPFLRRLDGAGVQRWTTYELDPMSGPENRLGGLVSDSAVFSAVEDGAGRILATTAGDGGNSILRRDPRDWTKPAPALRGSVSNFKGRILFWGATVVLDRDGGLLAGDHLVGRGVRRPGYGPTWGLAMADRGGGANVLLGRYLEGMRVEKAEQPAVDAAPGAFLRGQRLVADNSVPGAVWRLASEWTLALPGLRPVAMALREDFAVVAGGRHIDARERGILAVIRLPPARLVPPQGTTD